MVLFVCFVWKYELVFRMVGWVYRMISPLIYGFVIAFILNLLVRKIEKCMTGRMWQNQTVKRCISIILSVVIAVGVITAVLAGLIPEIVNSAKVLQEKLPAVLQNVAAWMEEIVTEEDYNALLATLSRTLGENDEYLEVFDENMQYSETPVVNSISEKLCDIYQDLKNFISAYRSGMIDVIEEALWQLNNSFELYWGKACASVLRAIHLAIYKVVDTDDSM